MKKLKMGMIGGGQGSFIGGVHRIAAAIDHNIELVCGAFSSTPEKSIASGKELGLPENRCYGTFQEMIDTEKQLPAEVRMDFVSIVTPNHMHFPPAKYALENGFHVICDKPATLTLDEAIELEKIVTNSGLIFALTHNYTGYPMVKQARKMVENGDLGAIRKVQVQYIQGWLADPLEETGQKQAAWRVDPKRAGIGGGLGDIATHAENLASYITNSELESVAADLHTHVKGRALDDDGNILLRYKNGAKGMLTYSQIAVGEENDLAIKVYGEKGGLCWSQQEPNTLIASWTDKPKQIFRTGTAGLYPEADSVTRIPAGHPEGYLEAFATIYNNFAKAVTAFKNNEKLEEQPEFPTIKDGVLGMKFIYAAVESSNNNSVWTVV